MAPAFCDLCGFRNARSCTAEHRGRGRLGQTRTGNQLLRGQPHVPRAASRVSSLASPCPESNWGDRASDARRQIPLPGRCAADADAGCGGAMSSGMVGEATSTGFEPAPSTLTGWRTGQIALRRHGSGERIRTAITWLTATGPAVGRHRNVDLRSGDGIRTRAFLGYEPSAVPNLATPQQPHRESNPVPGSENPGS